MEKVTKVQPKKRVTRHPSFFGIIFSLAVIVFTGWTIYGAVIGLVLLISSFRSIKKYECDRCGVASSKRACLCPNCGDFSNVKRRR